ncbi:methylated-DNA--[protein]-cysteine S-methyltransferase [Mumia sp. zg.B53]|uniref:methylated-DNA--[protein]-cysteine S-methyltransferase n=1 Tax=unclassified Mumia TaxID=2621872 RepID=UPI001C6E2830|nr:MULTISPECIES: methylated-DNA--[protein]-cysteine S-methyltransferase [unclassified Mumia]MBW9211293.1 methylated-DNA--[protein]-cysteine S-methyltransferase [Mumia sp. zg.B21]MBW9215868.1 methylated-DNA--[protein]-cysteine S-methyltransferase [Mumia sp. zg.B53]MDD9348574.1 methylated-DNA--[protein]-cysteine S-methyltransferase [Mumia sp.]
MTTTTTAYLDSPIGGLRVHSDGSAVVAIDFGADPAEPDSPRDAVLDVAVAQLEEYFAGERTTFDLPLGPQKGSRFQRAVWQALCDIPYGKTVTYGQLAALLELGAFGARAVGSANASNPIPIVVPCHRVIGANGTLTGYAGGLDRKQRLLDLEQGPALF